VRRHLGKAAFHIAVGERDVVGAVVGELPAEYRRIKRLRGRDVRRGELDVVDAVVVMLHGDEPFVRVSRGLKARLGGSDSFSIQTVQRSAQPKAPRSTPKGNGVERPPMSRKIAEWSRT